MSRTIQDFLPSLTAGTCDAASQQELAVLLERLRALLVTRAAFAEEIGRLEAFTPLWICRACSRSHLATDTHCPYDGTPRPAGLERLSG